MGSRWQYNTAHAGQLRQEYRRTFMVLNTRHF